MLPWLVPYLRHCTTPQCLNLNGNHALQLVTQPMIAKNPVLHSSHKLWLLENMWIDFLDSPCLLRVLQTPGSQPEPQTKQNKSKLFNPPFPHCKWLKSRINQLWGLLGKIPFGCWMDGRFLLSLPHNPFSALYLSFFFFVII